MPTPQTIFLISLAICAVMYFINSMSGSIQKRYREITELIKKFITKDPNKKTQKSTKADLTVTQILEQFKGTGITDSALIDFMLEWEHTHHKTLTPDQAMLRFVINQLKNRVEEKSS